MKYFGMLHFVLPVLLLTGSVLLFRCGKTVSTVLMLVGSALVVGVVALPLVAHIPVVSDFFGSAIERLSSPFAFFGGLVATGFFSVGFLCYALAQTHTTYQSA
jgi:hypothetical protein